MVRDEAEGYLCYGEGGGAASDSSSHSIHTDKSPVSVAATAGFATMNHGDALREREHRILALERENAMLRVSRNPSGRMANTNTNTSSRRVDLHDHTDSMGVVDHRNGQLAATSNTRSQPVRARSGRRVGLARSCSEEEVVNIFAKTVSVALTLAKGQRRFSSASDVQTHVAFRQFLLLSLDKNNIPHRDDSMVQEGDRHMDPFLFQHADVLDVFPPTEAEKSGDDSAFDPAALSPFCFPNGVKARLVPRIAVDCAARMGWAGKAADKYQVLVFTDGSGVASHGVAITVQEEVDSPALVAYLSRQRSRRRAATRIARCWRKYGLPNVMSRRAGRGCRPRRRSSGALSLFTRTESRHSLSDGESTEASCDTPRTQNSKTKYSPGICRRGSPMMLSSMFEGSPSQDNFKTRSPLGQYEEGDDNWMDKFLGSKAVSDELGFIQDRFGGKGSGAMKKGFPSKLKKKVVGKTPPKKPSKNGVIDIMDEFLKTSPIPQYDSWTQTGVWKSAKLRFRRKSNQFVVIIQHAPLKGEEDSSSVDGHVSCYDYSGDFKQECTRLVSMLKDAYISGPNGGTSSDRLRVSSICFQELVGLSTVPTNELHVTCGDEEHVAYTLAHQHAAEAYEAMREADDLGEACFVEKCYVMMGGKPQEQALLFAALQQLIDLERKKESIPEPDQDRRRSMLKLTETLTNALSITGVPDAPSDPLLRSRSRSRRLSLKTSSAEQKIRHNHLKKILVDARLSPKQMQVSLPQNDYDHLFAHQESFELKLPFQTVPPIEMPLPLPQVAGEWGLATLFLRIGGVEFMKVLKLLLLERSILVVGASAEEVTTCSCTLLELLKPYEWASTFLPLLPVSMLDLVYSPVPFIVGMAVQGEDEVKMVEEDDRVLEALEEGMGIVNLMNGSVTVALECGEDEMTAIPSRLSQRLSSLHGRLEKLAYEPSSSIGSMKSFVQHGLTRKESVTVHSLRKHILQYMTSLAGDIAVEKGAWARYGMENECTNGFDFYPDLYYESMCAELQFRREMAHTQLFSGFVHSRRNESLLNEQLWNGSAAKFIASWTYDKWFKNKQRGSRNSR